MPNAASASALAEAVAGQEVGALRAYLAHARQASVQLCPEAASWIERSAQAARELSPGNESRTLHCWLTVRPCSSICLPARWRTHVCSLPLGPALAALMRAVWLGMQGPASTCVQDGSCVQVARLVAQSLGHADLQEQDWQHMRALEQQRVQRERLAHRVRDFTLCASC